MESSGKPGMVHISEKTYSFLEEEYYVQKAEDLEGKECGDDHNSSEAEADESFLKQWKTPRIFDQIFFSDKKFDKYGNLWAKNLEGWSHKLETFI